MVDKKAFNDGSEGDTIVSFSDNNTEVFKIKTQIMGEVNNTGEWTQNEILKLLNDGRKYRLLKRAQALQKELIPQESE